MMRAPTICWLLALALPLAGLGAQDERPYLAIRCRTSALAEAFDDWSLEFDRSDDGAFTVLQAGGAADDLDWSPATDEFLAEVRIEPGGLRDGLCDGYGIAAGLLRGNFCSAAVLGGAPARYCARVFRALWEFPEQIDHLRLTVTATAERDRRVAGVLVPRTGSDLARWIEGIEADPRGALWLRDPAATLWLATAVRGPTVRAAWLGWWRHLATMRARQLGDLPTAAIDAAAERAAGLRDGRIALQWSTRDRSVLAVGSPDAAALAELEGDAAFRALARARLGEGPRQWTRQRLGDDQRATRIEDDGLPADRARFRAVRGDHLIEAVDERHGIELASLLRRVATGRARPAPLFDGAWLQAEFRRPPLTELQRLEIPFPLPVEVQVDDLASSLQKLLPERVTLAVRPAGGDGTALHFTLEIYGLGDREQ